MSTSIEFTAPPENLELLDPVDDETDTEELDSASLHFPHIDTTDNEWRTRFVEYDVRGPSDVVISGPVLGGWGPGRWFKNRRTAWIFACQKYGAERVTLTKQQSAGRWSFIVKGLKLCTM